MSDENGIAYNTTMNLDLNLRPATEDNPINLDEWSDDFREAIRRTRRQRWRWHNIENHQTESQNLTLDLGELLTSVGIPGRGVNMGEGSVAAEERVAEVEKVCEDKVIVVDEEAVGSQDDDKSSGEEGSFYDCNICFELAKDPVITCCGHLYCWPCIYRWLHINSVASECPVCKGEVTTKTVTPIYGRGHNKGVPEEDLTIRIPPRPTAKRVENRQLNDFIMPVEEMFRGLGSRFDRTSDFSAAQELTNTVNRPDRNPSRFLNRISTTRAMHMEQVLARPAHIVDLTRSETASPDALENIELQLRAHRARRHARNRSNGTRNPSPSSRSASERVIEAYIRSHPIVSRRPERSPPVDDRDSFSSIVAVMHSGSQSQTMDTAFEIDSVLSLSSSSARRRNDLSRASDVDSGDSRPPRRRRRLN